MTGFDPRLTAIPQEFPKAEQGQSPARDNSKETPVWGCAGQCAERESLKFSTPEED